MPATYAEYPTAQEVLDLFTAAGLTLPSGMDETAVDPFLYAAISEWEDLTRYHPFLEGASASFYYDPPGPNRKGENRGGGRTLLLDRGFTAITSIYTDVEADGTGGTLLVVGDDYRIEPYNAGANAEPYTRITFTAVQWGSPMSVKVTGTPGYTADLSAEVWNAIRMLAASNVCQALKEGRAGKAIEWSDGDGTSERKSIELLGQWGATWGKSARLTAKRHTLLN